MLNFKKLHFITLVTFLCLILVACNSETKNENDANVSDVEDTIVLKAVTAFEENTDDMIGYRVFKEKLEEKSEGRIKIDYLGGPESIESENQALAVSNRTVDIATLPTSYINTFPEGAVLGYSELTPEEERESGALDRLNEFATERINSIILGRAYAHKFNMYLKEPISSINEFKGLKLRGSPSYQPFIEALGAEFINISKSELYSAVDRGVVDGFGGTEAGIVDISLHEVIGAKIYPTYNNPNIVTIINKDTYDELPDDVKQLLIEVSVETEKEVEKLSEENVAEENKALEEAGVEIITLEEADEYKQLAQEVSMDWLEKNIENGKELRELFSK